MDTNKNITEIKVGIICFKNNQCEFEEKTYDIMRLRNSDCLIFTADVLEDFAKLIANKLKSERNFKEVLQGEQKINYDF